jgi:poly(3-hydroxybutyrate) depolymerase
MKDFSGLGLRGPIRRTPPSTAASDLASAFMAMRQRGGPEAFVKAGTPVPTIVFHGDRDTTVHPDNGGRILEQSAKATSPTTKVLRRRVPDGHASTCTIVTDRSRRAISEHWNIHGAGHAWAGGSPAAFLYRSAKGWTRRGNAAFQRSSRSDSRTVSGHKAGYIVTEWPHSYSPQLTITREAPDARSSRM